MKRLWILALPMAITLSCTTTPTKPEEGASEPLAHYKRWSEHLGQGGQPTGEAAFKRLYELGFRAVLSVDGALPDVEAAEKAGLKTIHVPIGYAGIGREEAVSIVKAVQSSEGAVYIHCHHGKHRGPAAVMLARIALEGVSNEAAVADLKASGCSPHYEGLYRDIAAFVPPSAEELEEVLDLPSQVAPEGFANEMVEVDAIWGRLLACKKASWGSPPENPDITPAQEALLLRERLHELARLEEASGFGPGFLETLSASEDAAGALETALRAKEDPAETFETLEASCKKCHRVFRDQ